MADPSRTLADLARLKSGREPIVSLYLDVRWSDEQQRSRARRFVEERVRRELAHYADGAPGREALARTLARVQAYAEGLARQSYEAEQDGVALFACESLGLWRPLFFRRTFRNELCLDAIPHLAQLARLVDDVAPAVVAVPSQHGADVYQVTLGDLAVETNLRGFVPRSDSDEFEPGPAVPNHRYEREQKSQRRDDTYVERNRKAAAAEVERLFDATPGSRVVLVGTSETLAAFERELPGRIRAKVIARLPRPRAWGSGDGIRRDGVVRGASAAIAAHEKAEEARDVEAVVGEALRGGLGVLGPDDVVSAVNQGRVRRLVLEEDFHRAGWRCGACGALGATDGDETCPYCGGELNAANHLEEELVARTLAEGGEIEVVAHTNKLHSYRGVGALLRQSAQSGFRGGAPGEQ